MIQRQLSKCHSNGGISWQNTATPTPPKHSCSRHASQDPVSCPNLDKGLVPPEPGFPDSLAAKSIRCSPTLSRGHATRAPLQSRQTLPAPGSKAPWKLLLTHLSICPPHSCL